MANLHLDRCILVPTFHVNHEILNLRLVRSSLLLIQSSDQLSNDAPLGIHLVEQDKKLYKISKKFTCFFNTSFKGNQFSLRVLTVSGQRN